MENLSGETHVVYVGPAIKPRNFPSFDKKDGIFYLLFLFVSVFTVMFGVLEGFSLGFTLSYLMFFSVTVAYLWKSNFKLKLYPTMCGMLSVIASFVYTIHVDNLMRFILFFVIIGLFSIFVCCCSSTNIYPTASYRTVFDIGNTAFVNPIKNATMPYHSFRLSQKDQIKSKKIVKILIGCLVTVPVLIFVVGLLFSADAVFENIVNKLFYDREIWIFRFIQIVIGVVLSPFVFSFAFGIKKKITTNSHENVDANINLKRLDATIVNTVLFILSLCYLVYLFSQLAYFFNAFSGLLPAGYEFTPAQYARRGFFEMTVIVAINLVFVGIAGAFTKGKPLHMHNLTKALCTFINAFSLVLVCTSLSKMLMYIDINGLSRKRVLTTVAMIVLAIIIVFVTIKIFVPKFKYVEFIVILCTVFGVGVAYADIDTQIAKYNYHAYTSGKLQEIDMRNMSSLSESVAPYMHKLAYDKDEMVSSAAKSYLADNEKQNTNIFSFTFANYNASKVYKDSKKIIDEYNKNNSHENFTIQDVPETISGNVTENTTQYVAQSTEQGTTQYVAPNNTRDTTQYTTKVPQANVQPFKWHGDLRNIKGFENDITASVRGYEFNGVLNKSTGLFETAYAFGDIAGLESVKISNAQARVYLRPGIYLDSYFFGSATIRLKDGTQESSGIAYKDDSTHSVVHEFIRQYSESEIEQIYLSYGKVD